MNPALGVLLFFLFVSVAIGALTAYAADDPKKRRRRVVISGCFATFFGGLTIAFGIGGAQAVEDIFTVFLLIVVLIGWALGSRGRG